MSDAAHHEPADCYHDWAFISNSHRLFDEVKVETNKEDPPRQRMGVYPSRDEILLFRRNN